MEPRFFSTLFEMLFGRLSGNNLQVIQTMDGKTDDKPASELESVTVGSEEYRRFILDNVLCSQSEGDIQYI